MLVHGRLDRIAPRALRLAESRNRRMARFAGYIVAPGTIGRVTRRTAWHASYAYRHRHDRGSDAIRQGRAMLRAWGVIRPVPRQGVTAVAKAVGRALRNHDVSRLSDHRHRHFSTRATISYSTITMRSAKLIGKAVVRMDEAMTPNRPLAPRAPGIEKQPMTWPRERANRSRRDGAVAAYGLGAAEWHGDENSRSPSALPVADVVGTRGQQEVGDLARQLGTLFSDEARRPPSGVTGFDERLWPIYPGRKPGF